MVRWLGFWAFTDTAQVQSLVGELTSHKQQGTIKKKKIIMDLEIITLRSKSEKNKYHMILLTGEV